MLLGSAGAGRKKSQRNTDIHRDICCQLIQDHVLTQPESHAEGLRVSQRGGVRMSLQDGKWASAEWGVLVTWAWGQQEPSHTHSRDGRTDGRTLTVVTAARARGRSSARARGRKGKGTVALQPEEQVRGSHHSLRGRDLILGLHNHSRWHLWKDLIAKKSPFHADFGEGL